MRSPSTLALLGVALLVGGRVPRRELPAVRPNPNIERAGVLHDGVLTIALEAKESTWHLDGDRRAPMTIEAFSEPGKSPLMPGPLVRATQGTEIRLVVRNMLRAPLTFFLPAAMHGGASGGALDSIVVSPGAVGVLTTSAAVSGNYLYTAVTPRPASRKLLIAGLLAGAIVIDTAGASGPPRDRVFVMMETPDSAEALWADTTHRAVQTPSPPGDLLFTINGRSWPNTERITASVNDSLHWRVINASIDTHPMHLHGFYYRVDAFSGPLVDREGQGPPRRMVVTERMSPFSAMSMSWSPDRPGNWIFHCHFSKHLTPDSLSASPDDPDMMGMVGLVLGISVGDRPGVRLAGPPSPTRHLRLVATADTGRLSKVSMRFVLEEDGRRVPAGAAFSPEIDLTRGEPVGIMVVNQLAEATTVHWHGIEVEDSYVDGVAGVSGAGQRLAPSIAPGDSFEVQFTPPRSGTFMYHAHMEEVLQERAGVEGALIVRDPGGGPSADDHVFFIKSARVFDPAHPAEINGQANPDTVVLRLDHPALLRFLDLVTLSPNPNVVSLTTRRDSARVDVDDTAIVRWLPVAKDGADLPKAAQAARLARQIMSAGETYDFEYTPTQRGTLRLEIRSSAAPGFTPGVLQVRVPIRVE